MIIRLMIAALTVVMTVSVSDARESAASRGWDRKKSSNKFVLKGGHKKHTPKRFDASKFKKPFIDVKKMEELNNKEMTNRRLAERGRK